MLYKYKFLYSIDITLGIFLDLPLALAGAIAVAQGIRSSPHLAVSRGVPPAPSTQGLSELPQTSGPHCRASSLLAVPDLLEGELGGRSGRAPLPTDPLLFKSHAQLLRPQQPTLPRFEGSLTRQGPLQKDKLLPGDKSIPQ